MKLERGPFDGLVEMMAGWVLVIIVSCIALVLLAGVVNVVWK